MVAGILAFALGPLLLMSQNSIGRTDHDMRRILAVNLSNRMLERFAALPYPALRRLLAEGFDPETDPLLAPPTLPEALRLRLAEYTKQVRFREVTPGRLGVLEVEVRWQAKRGSPEARLRAVRVVMNEV